MAKKSSESARASARPRASTRPEKAGYSKALARRIDALRRSLTALQKTDDAYWRAWRTVGRQLARLREEFRCNQAFGEALAARGVDLTPQQRCAAIRLAQMSWKELKILRRRHPESRSPAGLLELKRRDEAAASSNRWKTKTSGTAGSAWRRGGAEAPQPDTAPAQLDDETLGCVEALLERGRRERDWSFIDVAHDSLKLARARRAARSRVSP